MPSAGRWITTFWRRLGSILANLIATMGLALLAWGPGDVTGFFTAPARMLFAALVIVQSVVSGYLAPVLPRIDVPKHSDPLTHWRLIALETILVLSVYSDRSGMIVMAEWLPLRLIGLVIFAAGAAWSTWSSAIYRRHFHLAPADPSELGFITKGPYRYIRYPIALGSVIRSLGIALTFRSWVGLALISLLLTVALLRIREEERWASRTFGVVWHDYSRRSWRLLPPVY